MTTKTHKAWAVFDPEGDIHQFHDSNICVGSAIHIAKFNMTGSIAGWNHYKKLGYTVRKIEIKEVE